jgi:hypothetical protein
MMLEERMTTPTWWQRIRAAVNTEYERRLRRASRLDEHGHTPHLHDHHDHAAAAEPAESSDDAVIVNLPRGTRTH